MKADSRIDPLRASNCFNSTHSMLARIAIFHSEYFICKISVAEFSIVNR